MSATAQTNGRSSRGPRVPLVNPVADPAPLVAEPAGVQLAAAVLQVQAKAGKLIRNADGQVGPRQYRYVTLDAVVDEVLPLLVEHELLWRCFPTVLDDGRPGLRYRITHLPSGESEEDTMPLQCANPDPQGQGSGITYARRYALTAYLNLTIDPDDDGRAATVSTVIPNAQPQGQGQPSDAPQPTAAAAKPTPLTASAKQKGMLRARAAAAGLEPSAFANVILTAAGDEPRTWVSEKAAAETLKRLVERLPGALVDAVLAGIASS